MITFSFGSLKFIKQVECFRAEKKEALAREDRLESVLESNKDPIGKLLRKLLF